MATSPAKTMSPFLVAVKEKAESKPRQHTIDLSQMAVPIQLAQEKKQSPESPSLGAVEPDLGAEYISAGLFLRQLSPALTSWGGGPSEHEHLGWIIWDHLGVLRDCYRCYLTSVVHVLIVLLVTSGLRNRFECAQV